MTRKPLCTTVLSANRAPDTYRGRIGTHEPECFRYKQPPRREFLTSRGEQLQLCAGIRRSMQLAPVNGRCSTRPTTTTRMNRDKNRKTFGLRIEGTQGEPKLQRHRIGTAKMQATLPSRHFNRSTEPLHTQKYGVPQKSILLG